MNVLVMCESSGTVRDAFIAKGHNAVSVDMLPTSAPGPHHEGDCLAYFHDSVSWGVCWDLIIAHPPCTYLCSSGMHWTARGLRDPQLTEDALDFVRKIMTLPCKRIAIENPVGCISTRIRRPDQYIKPYQFGHDASKKAGLWLKGLPLLKPTEFIEPRVVNGKNRWANQTDSGQNRSWLSGGGE